MHETIRGNGMLGRTRGQVIAAALLASMTMLATMLAMALVVTLGVAAPAQASTTPPPASESELRPTIDRPDTFFSTWGEPLTINGTGFPGAVVFVAIDPRGPVGPQLLTATLVGLDGRWSATFTPTTDVRVFAVTAEVESRSVVAFLSPTIDGPRITEQQRPAPKTISGRGTPGSSLQISYRRPGDPAGVYPVVQSLPVDAAGRWSKELPSVTSWQFRVQRTPTSPVSAPWLVQARFGQSLGELQLEMQATLRRSTWPANLKPTIIPGRRLPFLSEEITRCVRITPVPSSGCVWGPADAPRTAVIVGDSVATSLVEPLRAALLGTGQWRLYNYSATGCTFTGVDTVSSNATVQELCPQKKREALAAIDRLEPDVVFVSNVYGGRKQIGAANPMGYAEWKQNTGAILEKVQRRSGQIVLLAPPPLEKDITECYRPTGNPAACVGGVPPIWYAIAKAERELAADLAGTWVDTRLLFCEHSSGRCPALVGDTAVKPDIVHVSREYGLKVIPQLTAVLRTYGVL